jgi:hypothetical protein
MPERMGQWTLLGHDADPVIADTAVIDERVAHYRKIADEMQVNAQRLDRIADGTALKGRYADELRSSSGEVARDLHKVVGRYEAVATALEAYEPAVEQALIESQGALDDAVSANGVSQAAAGMPTEEPADGQELTAEQTAHNDEKTARTNQAADALSAAKARLSSALGTLDAAGQAAARTISGGFDDGLKDSGWDRFVYGFMKFLKILVKVLTYLAMALAVIALVIPGLGEAIFAATMALAAIDVAANAALVGTGNGTWADFGIAIAGLLTFGVGKLFGPAIQAGLKSVGSSVKSSVSGAIDTARGIGRGPRPAVAGVDEAGSSVSSGRSSFESGSGGSGTGRASESGSSRPGSATSSVNDADEAASDALVNYSGGGFERINKMLRGIETFPEAEQAAMRDTVAAVRQRLAELPDAGEVTTYRGLVGDIVPGAKSGQTFTDPGFMSTSLSRESAEEFIATGGKLNGVNDTGLGTLLKIQGTGGRDISHLNALGEREILYDANSTFAIDGAKSSMESIVVNGHKIDFRVIFLRSPSLERE